MARHSTTVICHPLIEALPEVALFATRLDLRNIHARYVFFFPWGEGGGGGGSQVHKQMDHVNHARLLVACGREERRRGDRWQVQEDRSIKRVLACPASGARHGVSAATYVSGASKGDADFWVTTSASGVARVWLVATHRREGAPLRSVQAMWGRFEYARQVHAAGSRQERSVRRKVQLESPLWVLSCSLTDEGIPVGSSGAEVVFGV